VPAGFLDSLKYIPLRRENEDYYLAFGLWIRERSEYFSNFGLGSGPPGNAYPMQRYYGHLDLHLGERFRFFGELGSSIETGQKTAALVRFSTKRSCTCIRASSTSAFGGPEKTE